MKAAAKQCLGSGIRDADSYAHCGADRCGRRSTQQGRCCDTGRTAIAAGGPAAAASKARPPMDALLPPDGTNLIHPGVLHDYMPGRRKGLYVGMHDMSTSLSLCGNS